MIEHAGSHQLQKKEQIINEIVAQRERRHDGIVIAVHRLRRPARTFFVGDTRGFLDLWRIRGSSSLWPLAAMSLSMFLRTGETATD